MKFNWGTGILTFLILFLLACGLFIGFAMRQDVSLVHEDYYERGVDHSEQMRLEARSVQFQNDISIRIQDGALLLEIHASLATQMDSSRMHLYRPSNSKLDLIRSFDARDQVLVIPGDELISGRYILKIFWSDSAGLKYEVDKDVFIP